MFNIQLNPNERTGGKSDVREADGDVASDADVHVSVFVMREDPNVMTLSHVQALA